MAHSAVHRPLRPRASHARMHVSTSRALAPWQEAGQIRSLQSQSLWSAGKKSSSGRKAATKHREGCTGEEAKAGAGCAWRPCPWLGTVPLPALNLGAPRARERGAALPCRPRGQRGFPHLQHGDDKDSDLASDLEQTFIYRWVLLSLQVYHFRIGSVPYAYSRVDSVDPAVKLFASCSRV